jgi:hypothetical protein
VAAGDVSVSILLNAKDNTSAGITSATSSLGKLEKATSLARVAMGALAGAAGFALAGALSDMANAAANDEANMAKLQQAVENSGVAFEDVSAVIDERIKKGQSLAFTDDQIRDSLTALTNTTGSLSEALDLQGIALDLSRTKGMDLTKASELVGRVHEGNTGILKRYGIVLKDGATATDALAALQQKFAGQAETYGNSTAGSIFKVHDAIDEWRESIGHAMGPAQGIIALLPGLTAGMSLAGTAMGGLSSLIRLTFIPSLIALAIPFLPIILAVAAVGAAIALLALAWTNNWGDIQGKTKAAVEFIFTVLDALGAAWSAVWDGIVAATQAAVAAILGPINAIISAVQNAISWLQNLSNQAASGIATSENPNAVQPGFASGISFVPFDMTARIHQGERIIPANQNRAGGGGSMTVNVYGDVDSSDRVRELGVELYRQYRLAGGMS